MIAAPCRKILSPYGRWCIGDWAKCRTIQRRTTPCCLHHERAQREHLAQRRYMIRTMFVNSANKVQLYSTPPCTCTAVTANNRLRLALETLLAHTPAPQRSGAIHSEHDIASNEHNLPSSTIVCNQSFIHIGSITAWQRYVDQ